MFTALLLISITSRFVIYIDGAGIRSINLASSLISYCYERLYIYDSQTYVFYQLFSNTRTSKIVKMKEHQPPLPQRTRFLKDVNLCLWLMAVDICCLNSGWCGPACMGSYPQLLSVRPAQPVCVHNPHSLFGNLPRWRAHSVVTLAKKLIASSDAIQDPKVQNSNNRAD